MVEEPKQPQKLLFLVLPFCQFAKAHYPFPPNTSHSTSDQTKVVQTRVARGSEPAVDEDVRNCFAYGGNPTRHSDRLPRPVGGFERKREAQLRRHAARRDGALPASGVARQGIAERVEGQEPRR